MADEATLAKWRFNRMYARARSHTSWQKRREQNWRDGPGIKSAVDMTKGLKWAEFEARYHAQGGCCANPFCAKPLDMRTEACADHCHITGQFRGILCRNCNTREGTVKDMTIDEFLWFKKYSKNHLADILG